MRLRAPLGRGLELGGEKMAKEDWILGTGGSEGLGWGSGNRRVSQVGSGVLNSLMWKRGICFTNLHLLSCNVSGIPWPHVCVTP